MDPSELDLCIDHYTIGDLEKFFQFREHSKYTANDVIARAAKLQQVLMPVVDQRYVRELIEFLDHGKNWLIHAKCDPVPPPTTLPKRPRIDTSTFPVSQAAHEYAIQHPIDRADTVIPRTLSDPVSTITRSVTIDSRFRTPYVVDKGSDFTVQLPFKLTNVISMHVNSFEIPITFFCFTKKNLNHYLYLRVVLLPVDNNGDEGGGGGDEELENTEEERVLEIPEGNYGASDLVEQWNSVFAALPADDPFHYFVMTVDIRENNSGTGKLTITNSYPDMVSFVLDFSRDERGLHDFRTPVYYRMGWHLGFRQTVYENQLSYTTESVIDPAVTRYLFLVVDDGHNAAHDSHVTANHECSLNGKHVLARIPLKQMYFTILMSNDVDASILPRKYFGPVDIQRLQVRLLDDFGRIVPLNGSDFSFALTVTMIHH